MWLQGLILAYAGALVLGQCPVDIPESERRDCYPWSDSDQTNCEARGCVWCSTQTPDIPWCYTNDKVCPSTIPELSRVECASGTSTKDQCLINRCLWCESQTGGVPWCFQDPNASQGGVLCPAEIAEGDKIDCLPEARTSTEQACLQRGCFWCVVATPNVPYCITPRQSGYRMRGSETPTPEGYRVVLDRINTPTWLGSDIQTVTLDVEFHTDQRLRLKFYDGSAPRFEVPVYIDFPGSQAPSPDYSVTFEPDPFAVKVTRVSTGTIIFDTSLGGLQIADQFLQIATRLETDNVYGFGEHEHPSFKHNLDWRRWGMWARDLAVTDSNLYGVHPYYMNIESTNDVHSVLFLNANAQDVQMQPGPALTYRTSGGVLDIYIFMGPTAEQVNQQYLTAVGLPVMPPYWALGFQLCRWGYSNLNHMQQAVNRMRQYDIPHDIQYGDIDYMDQKRIFTLDTVNFGGLPAYVDDLLTQGTRFVIILDPAVYSGASPGSYPPLDNGNALDVWIKDPTGSIPQEGEVWPGPTYYPDWFLPATQTWWTKELQDFKNVLDYRAIWIDMNEPSNFAHGTTTGCAFNSLNDPPYLPNLEQNEPLYQKTLCMDCETVLRERDDSIRPYKFYNTHSLYGFSMANVTYHSARDTFPADQRSVVFSRSTFPGAGQWSQHWLGDNFADWDNVKYSIIGMMEFNMFGMPYVGADICGFIGVPSEEMCRRWQQVGAFYPFSRNHNSVDDPDQDPGMWPTVAADTRKTLMIRYTLLPYLYTLFHRAHTTGSTVVRPLAFEFTSETATHAIDEQFLWGPAFLVSPALYQGQNTVTAYFPDARWYDYYDGLEETTRGTSIALATPIDDINLHIRGGYILPTQQPANSTMWSRSNPMGLIVALDDVGAASGSLFWDDGEDRDTAERGVYFEGAYSVSGGTLSGSVVTDGYTGAGSLRIDDIRILGQAAGISSVLVNGGSHADWDQNPTTNEIDIRTADIALNSAFTVSWS